MKDKWPIKLLVDICDVFADGDWIESKDQSSEGIRLIQTGNIGEGVFKDRVEKARYISEATFKRLHCTEIIKGDCLISRLPDPVGRSCILPDTGGKMITAVDCTIIRFNQKEMLPEFFNYYSQSLDYLKVVDAETTGTTRKRISRSKLGQLAIPVPQISDQQRIVRILDEAFDGIAQCKSNTECNLLNAHAIFDSSLQTIFSTPGLGWMNSTIGDTVRFIDYRGKTPIKTLSGVRLITAKNVKMGYLQKTPIEYIASSNYQGWMTRGIPNKGDVLFTTEAPLANVAQLDTDEKVAFAQRIIVMQPNPKDLDSAFLKYLLLSQPVQQRIRTKGTGATVQGIKARLLKTIDISYPRSLAEQKSIVERLDNLRAETQRLVNLYERKIATLNAFKRSLLHKAFAGELTRQSHHRAIIPFPAKIPRIATTDLHAGILAIAYQAHEMSGKHRTFGHVKAEKISHMIEAYVGIDLGRVPVKDAAGPNDYPHLLRVEHRAKKAGFFDFKRVDGAGYQVQKYRLFNELIERIRKDLGDQSQAVDNLLQLMLPMDTKQAEIFATVYSAWNNLLLDGQLASDENIVYEARENWHPEKLNIPRDKFLSAVCWMREKGIIPEGKGKKVGAKASKKHR